MNRTNQFLIACGFIGPIIFFASLILVSLFFPGFNHIRDYISELGAVDSPVQFLANTFVFFLMGVCMTLFSIGLYRTIGIDWSGQIASLLLLISGIGFTLIAFFPCDAICVNYTITGQIHEILSDGSLYVGGLTLLFLAIHAYKQLTLKRYWAYLFAIAALLAGLLGYAYPEMDTTSIGGIVQRFAILIPFAVMATSAYSLYRLNLPPSPTHKLSSFLISGLLAFTVFGLVSYRQFYLSSPDYPHESFPNPT